MSYQRKVINYLSATFGSVNNAGFCFIIAGMSLFTWIINVCYVHTDMDTLLANVTSRNKLLDDLMELIGFLTQRIAELRSDSDFPLAGQVGVTHVVVLCCYYGDIVGGGYLTSAE